MPNYEKSQEESNLFYAWGEYEELLRHCESYEPPWGFLDDNRPFHTQSNAPFNIEAGSAWFGNCPTFEDAIKKARTGCPETTEKVLALRRHLEDLEDVVKVNYEQEWRRDVAGVFPLIPAVVAGDPETMIDIVEKRTLQDKYGEVVRLYCTVGGSGTWDAHHFFEYGAALTLFIDWLENQDVRAELVAVINVMNVSKRRSAIPKFFQAKIKIKNPEQPVDLDRVAFVFSEVGFYRRVIFRLQESYEWSRKNLYQNRGSSIDRIPEEYGNEHTSMQDGVLLPSMRRMREAGILDPDCPYTSDIKKMLDTMILVWTEEAKRRL